MGFTKKASKLYFPSLKSPPKKSLESAIEINVNSLKDDKRGSYMSEARPYSDTPQCAADSGQDKVTEGGA